MTDDDVSGLQQQVESLIASNEQLMRENEVFLSYLNRHMPDASEQMAVEEDEGRKGRLGKKTQKKTKAKPVALTWDQKVDIARGELEEIKKDAVETERNSVRMIDTLKALLEQTDVRIAEMKKEAYEFKRDIVVGAENFRSGRTMAEKVIRYMEEKLRQKDSLIEKLRLKNSSLKAQVKQMQSHLQQKQETGDVLHYIDFHQLQIENKQFAAKIEEKNGELLALKSTTANTVLMLTNLKQQLSAATKEVTSLKTQIKQRTELLAKLHSNSAVASLDSTKSLKLSAKLKVQAEDQADMPSVMDYLNLKGREFDLSREVANWQRKLEIAEMASRRPVAEDE